LFGGTAWLLAIMAIAAMLTASAQLFRSAN
jgi:hypothetical protein